MSVKTDVRVEETIARAPAFARPILTHLRRLVHAGCPDVEETIKWGRATFVYRGRLLCGMAAFKAHCGFGFWHPEMAVVAKEQGGEKAEGSSGQFGRLTRLEDLPDDATMRRYIEQAMRLNEAGQPAARSRPATGARDPAATVPPDLLALLDKNPGAKVVFEGFCPSHRREYIEWINEAKREETRQKRLATTLEWLMEGKTREWKYQAR